MNPTAPRRNGDKPQDPLISGSLPMSQIQMIQEALQAVGDFGEVRLIVEKGRIRYVVIQKSLDALSWQPDRSKF